MRGTCDSSKDLVVTKTVIVDGGAQIMLVIKWIRSCRLCLNSCHPTAITIRRPTVSPQPQKHHFTFPQQDSISPRTEMRFSFLAAVVALTAPMFVSACYDAGVECANDIDCCGRLICDYDASVSKVCREG